jgi:uncharacterized protein YaiI (UPF0178 family)
MKIIIDADACPVLKEVESVSKKYKIEVIIVKNYNHVIRSNYSEVISVDSCGESADLKIANITEKGDIIVTQDYGLCAMIIAKDAIAINQYGKVINSFNIDLELYKRDMNREIRMKHKKYTKFKKRVKKDNDIFKMKFDELLNEMK